MERKKYMAEQKRKEREEYYHRLGINPDDSLQIPASSKWKEIQEREQEEQKLREFFDGEVKDRARRKLEYSKIVKKDYWPEVSEKKKQELQDIKQKLTTVSVRRNSKVLTSRK